jgi:hypothetical protein
VGVVGKCVVICVLSVSMQEVCKDGAKVTIFTDPNGVEKLGS